MTKFKDVIYKDENKYKGTLVRRGSADIVMIDPVKDFDQSDVFLMANGPALRDALLEAFPLPEKIDPVPGMVVKCDHGPLYYVLPTEPDYETRLSFNAGLLTFPTGLSWEKMTVVFDPRDAKALPNPLGIRVGDRVRRVEVTEGVTRTTEFEVHIVATDGYLYSKYQGPFNPEKFEVVSREVPDRLPAGTIVRTTEGLRLITEKGGIYLSGYTSPVVGTSSNPDPSDYSDMVKRGEAEVIYLP